MSPSERVSTPARLSRRSSALILIYGPPGVGKSHFAERLATDLNLPLISKDEIKETLFDQLGVGDVAWSQKLGALSFLLMFQTAEKLARGGSDFIIDCAFGIDVSRSRSRFETLQQNVGFRPLEIRLFADPRELHRRRVERVARGERHVGHADHLRLPKTDSTPGADGELALGGPVININTTNFAEIPYTEVKQSVANHLTSS